MIAEKKKILQHPTLELHDSLKDICQPLQLLDIDYFCQVRIDSEGKFTALANNSDYHIHYLERDYYNCDIHMAQDDSLGDMILWDFVKRYGDSAQMAQDAAEFGISHLFTLVKRTESFTEYFHFASSHADETINQCYISQRQFLEQFICYFNDKVQGHKALAKAWDIDFGITEDKSDFTLSQNLQAVSTEAHQLEYKKITVTYGNRRFQISTREQHILHWLSLGKTAEDIALICQISPSTVRKHIENIKKKSACYTLFQLGELYGTLKHI